MLYRLHAGQAAKIIMMQADDLLLGSGRALTLRLLGPLRGGGILALAGRRRAGFHLPAVDACRLGTGGLRNPSWPGPDHKIVQSNIQTRALGHSSKNL